jgi:hypothetical protein
MIIPFRVGRRLYFWPLERFDAPPSFKGGLMIQR